MRVRSLIALCAFALLACDARPATLPAAPPPAARPVALIRREGNHLLGQASPYLEQHAHNPVDWYPWGAEALALAVKRSVPIFLSIGYATCHWCHVMERESFEDDETARYLNAHFVSIKVDREQRPDLDALFIEAVGRLGGATGWPLTVILTPELEPIFGGTYFARTGGRGAPSLMEVLAEVLGKWRAQGPELARRGRDLLAQIQGEARARAGSTVLAEGTLDAALTALEGARDPQEGGFGTRRKFPNTPLLLAELRLSTRKAGGAAARAHVAFTLEKMMRGGIRDQLAGSFHRYATDRRWHVPHFEKTLYDNAQLAALYLEAGRTLARPDFVQVGRAVLDDLLAGWQRPDGGLIVGFDADDAGGEGAFSTFTPAELRAALGDEDAKIIAALYDVTDGGEPSLGGRSVLHRREPSSIVPAVAPSLDALALVEARALPKLRALREKRPRPAVDDKELAAWNGLALIALADAARTLDEPRYLDAAQRVARFLLDRCWDPASRTMRRGLRGGASLGEGFLSDHVLPALGLLRLHAADGDLRWLKAARDLAANAVERFHDPALDAFVEAAPEPSAPGGSLPLRRPETDDGVLPSGSAAATLLMLEIGAVAGDDAFFDRGLSFLRASASRLAAEPFASGALLVAADRALADPREVVIAGAPDDPRTRVLLRALAGAGDARISLTRLPAEGAPERVIKLFPALAGKRALGDRPTAFVCRRGTCEAPTSDPSQLGAQLTGAR
ncbi:MAG: thioredoxin domain-containing protein [Minicystis sp.]